MRKLIEQLKNIELAIFDLDGVIYKGNKLISDSDKVITSLKELRVKVVYNSNNSTVTRQMYVDRLKGFNIESEILDFYTSASITASEITKVKQNAKIYVIGEIGLKEELKSCGHEVVNAESNHKVVDFVIVGLDRDLTYVKLAFAQRCILEGSAKFYATNADASLPVATGLLPGAGVMVNAVETCTNQKPVKIFGKPNPEGIQSILEDTNSNPIRSVIFGDRLNTDILAGNRAGINTALVLTGVTKASDVEKLWGDKDCSPEAEIGMIPNIVINSLKEIFMP
ncbi:MAG TPA: HAD-IIA family hydrolase [Candidatus Nanopelagicaceae bacterium]|nr:HAD-IIA family hydrolase [Candidatus Nanopelagicaceae bacterium]